ncbi:DUF5590 domain-containing protein [Paenibacillus hodogayensis]|uniref:DUF5590 domain-containing protein n=1 Tax=Paenibacillus hodogayensis TaxID=279208 RepID=A0ABV5W5J6_9BACL
MVKKIAYGTVIGLVLIAAVLVFFYRTIHGEEWALEAAAKQTVTETTYMKTVDRVESFVGEKPYIIVFGQDPDGNKAIAWVNDGNAHMQYASTGVSEDDVRGVVEQANPDNEVLRIVPGVLNDNYVWEALYKRKEEDDRIRYYYGYYRFDNGAEIDTWRMTKR